ncbi:class I SAM-dependent methyltransferase [bacterium]|nr:class I SAM-dependent methyltransferase [bacterium]
MAVALTYPGEWTHISPSSARWLYDRGAGNYQRKWNSRYYSANSHQERIALHIAAGLCKSKVNHVLDLGCGTGRGIRLVHEVLPIDTQFTMVDFSPGMLDQLRLWLHKQDGDLADRTSIVESELGSWAAGTATEYYGAVFLLEVGEFVPGFAEVIRHMGSVTAPGGTVVMTRPAGIWSRFFPLRKQSRAALGKILLSSGFESPEFMRWRSRYELVFSRKLPI